MNPIDRFGTWSGSMTKNNPLIGWPIVIVSAPFALFLSIIALLMGAILVTPAGVGILLVYITLAAIGYWKKEYEPNSVLDGPSGKVIFVLSAIGGILSTAIACILIYMK
jgi:hypothetical protein